MKRLIILYLFTILQLNFIFSEVKTEPVFFLSSYDSEVFSTFKNEIVEMSIIEWKAVYINEEKEKVSELIMKFDNKGNIIYVSFVNKRIKNPIIKNFTFNEDNNLVRDETLYEAAAPYIAQRSVNRYKRIYDENKRVKIIKIANFSGYTKEIPVDEVQYLDATEEYKYYDDGKIKEIIYYKYNKATAKKEFTYYSNGNIKSFRYYKNDRLESSEIFNEKGNIIKSYKMAYNTEYKYDENDNLIECTSFFAHSGGKNIHETIFNKYDKKNNKVESLVTSYTFKGKVVSKKEFYYNYNDQNQLVEEKKIFKDKFNYHQKYEYDEKGNIKKIIYLTKNGKNNLIDLFLYEYNHIGLVTKRIKKHGNPKFMKTLKESVSIYTYIIKK